MSAPLGLPDENTRPLLGLCVAIVAIPVMAAMSFGDLVGSVLTGPNPLLGNSLAIVGGAVVLAGIVLTASETDGDEPEGQAT